MYPPLKIYFKIKQTSVLEENVKSVAANPLFPYK
jgi:hypothetical protein